MKMLGFPLALGVPVLYTREMSPGSGVEQSVEAELAYLYEEKLLLDQIIRQLERFARLSGQLSSSSSKDRNRKTRSARASM